jgi:N-acetyl-alpha-D-muramate 1-phosphate uridylyltransferase
MKQAMIFAAGLGTRLKPLTDRIPKALVRVGDKTLLERIIEILRDAGIDEIVINVHHFAQQIRDFLKDNSNFGTDIRISDESDMLLDTGGGLRKASLSFNGDDPILIHNVDILSNVNLKEFYERNISFKATLLVSSRKTSRYLLFDNNNRLVGWTNIQTGEVKSPYRNLNPDNCLQYAFSGIHLFSPSLFPKMQSFPDKFGIIDFYLSVCDEVEIHADVKNDLRLMDVGKLDTLAQAEDFILKNRNSK